jgi:peptidoglycan hydrolase CwlO-like protein
VGKFIPVEPEKWAEMVKAQAEVETLRNLGIKLESMIDPLEAENARLKAEVERLNNESDILQKCCEHQKNRIERLKAEVERLTKAGDDLAANIGNDERSQDICADAWRAAKKGGQP